MTTPAECPHEYPLGGNTILAVCRLCGYRYVSNDIHGDALTFGADLFEFLATVEEDPQTAEKTRKLAESMRHRARHEARWGWAWKLLAPLAHTTALWVLFFGFWAWWLLTPPRWTSLGDSALITWLFRAAWSGWMLTMIVWRTQQIRRRRGKMRRKS